METLYIILAFVWSILCLILFFKVWGMTNDVKELKEFFLHQHPITQSKTSSVHSEDMEEPNINWIPKFKIGDIVKYKHSGKSLYIAKILEKEYEYKCKDANGTLLSATFLENELY